MLTKGKFKTLYTLHHEVNIYTYDKETILRESSQDTENSQYGNCSYQLDFLILSRILGLAKINVN